MKEKHIQKINKFLFFGLLIYYQFYWVLITFLIFIKAIDKLILYSNFPPEMVNLECKPKDNVPIYVSIATTPSRVENFIKYSLPNFKEYEDINIIINLCKRYKRFNDTINENFIHKIDNFKNIHIHWTDDYGPITKLVGGEKYMKKYNLNGHFLVADDDDYYRKKLFYRLINLFNEVYYEKTSQILVCGSIYQFKFPTANMLNYIPYKNKISKWYEFYQIYKKNKLFICHQNNKGFNFLVEGFKGILFNNKLQKNTDLDNFIKYYKAIDYCKNNDNLINIFLKNSFLADDFVISYFYKNYEVILDTLYKINNKIHYSFDYGFKNDALHKTYSNCDDGNTKRYKFLRKNQIIFQVFCNKIKLNKEIINKWEKKK